MGPKVLDTGPKSKTPREDHPMVKKRIKINCAKVARMSHLWTKYGNWALSECLVSQKKRIWTLRNLDTLKIWTVLAIFLTFAPTNNSITFGKFSQFLDLSYPNSRLLETTGYGPSEKKTNTL